jgi:hypothetical protein
MARSSRGLAAIAVMALIAPCAFATPLPPGATVQGSTPGNIVQTYQGTVVAVIPFADSTFSFMGPSGPTVGFISSAAVKTSAPGLDFVYQVNVSVGTVNGFSFSGFHNAAIDVTQTANRSGLANTNQFFPGNVPVTTYTRTAAPGDTVDVTFAGGVSTEQASNLVIVHTDSTTFVPSIVNIGGLQVPALAPVPEPATLALWSGTLGGLGCWIAGRRRRLTKAIEA